MAGSVRKGGNFNKTLRLPCINVGPNVNSLLQACHSCCARVVCLIGTPKGVAGHPMGLVCLPARGLASVSGHPHFVCPQATTSDRTAASAAPAV